MWTRTLELDREPFANAAEDVQIILSRLRDMGLRIAGPAGAGKPEMDSETIAFNGAAACGHRYRDLGKPFASPTASGVEEREPPYDAAAEPWYSGPYLDTRVCGGNCAAQPFVMDRKYMVRDWERPIAGGHYDCECETHFKPYDLAVTAALIRIKERLGDAIEISSENPDHGFDDAKRLCRELFGWGSRFDIKNPHTEMIR
jgi:hypothetical protein